MWGPAMDPAEQLSGEGDGDYQEAERESVDDEWIDGRALEEAQEPVDGEQAGDGGAHGTGDHQQRRIGGHWLTDEAGELLNAGAEDDRGREQEREAGGRVAAEADRQASGDRAAAPADAGD